MGPLQQPSHTPPPPSQPVEVVWCPCQVTAARVTVSVPLHRTWQCVYILGLSPTPSSGQCNRWPEMYMLNGGAPFRRDRRTGAVHDSSGTRIKLLGSTLDIFTQIATDPVWANTEVAYVSRTEYPEWAIPCLQQFEIPGTDGLTLLDIAAYKEIYPGSKVGCCAGLKGPLQPSSSTLPGSWVWYSPGCNMQHGAAAVPRRIVVACSQWPCDIRQMPGVSLFSTQLVFLGTSCVP